MLKIVRTDQELEMPRVDAALRELGAQLVTLPETICEADLVKEVQDADLLLMCYTTITRRVIESARKLKGIVKYGVGIDAIDIEAAKLHRIPVVNIPEYAEETVAEGAFALLMALAKKSQKIYNKMASTGWAWPNAEWLGLDLAGKTLGLVGVGRIGSKMARMASAGFRMKVLGYDPYVSQERMQTLNVIQKTDLLEMFSECDFVSVHCVLTPETRHLISSKELRSMKSSAFLINVSRGNIVDEAALLEVLQSNVIAGAGLDVYSQEPLSLRGHPLSVLYSLEQVILWPHLAFYTDGAMKRLEDEVLERCHEVLNDIPVLIKSGDPRLRSQIHGVKF